MSTEYLTMEPCTLVEFYKYIDEYGISHGAQDVMEVNCTDGETRVLFIRYGQNKVDEILYDIPCYSEHDAEFDGLLFGPEELEQDITCTDEEFEAFDPEFPAMLTDEERFAEHVRTLGT